MEKIKSQKYIGLVGMIFGAVLLFVEVGFQNFLSKGVFILLVILTIGLAILSWQYTIYGNLKKSILPTLKITVMVVIIGIIIGLLKKSL